jgi:hypothetical protein
MATTATAASILAFSCGDPIGATPADAEADVPAPDAGRRPPSDSGVEEPRGPEYDNDGWLRIDVEPTRECPAYTPTRSDQMPPGIEWEPCAEPILAVYPSCRRMKTDGPFNDRLNGFVVGGYSGMVDASGKAVLAFGRASTNVTHLLVGEADGPIRHAIRTATGPCQLELPRLAAGRVLYPHYQTPERGTQQGYRYGAIGGTFDEAAVVLDRMAEGIRKYSAGPDVFFDGDAFRPWAPDAPILSSIGERVDFEPGIFIGDAFFFRPNTSGDTGRVRIHQPGTGLRDFLWYGDDVASSAAYFGTDGKDMVWIEAFGRAHVGDDWAVIDLVTAPYTTDPTKIAKRRLRSMETVYAAPFVVGCGHTAPSSLVSGTRAITRLSDGRFVMLEDILGDGGRAASFTHTLAITCEEIFVNLMATFPDYSIARIRLEDFGLGDVPDGGR